MIPRALKKVTGGLPALNPNEARGDLLVPMVTAFCTATDDRTVPRICCRRMRSSLLRPAADLYIVFAVCVLLDVAMWQGAWCVDPSDPGGLVARTERFNQDD